MSSLVCQIPGCKTSQGEIEAELQTYLGGYCQACEKEREGRLCGCAFPCSLTFKGQMLGKIHSLLGINVPQGMKAVQVCYKHPELLKQAREKCIASRDSGGEDRGKQEGNKKERVKVVKRSAEISLSLEGMEEHGDTLLGNLGDKLGEESEGDAGDTVTSIVYTDEGGREQQMVGKIVYQTDVSGQSNIIIQEMEQGDLCLEGEDGAGDKIMKINFSDMDGYMMEEGDQGDGEEEMEQRLEEELEGREARLEEELDFEAASEKNIEEKDVKIQFSDKSSDNTRSEDQQVTTSSSDSQRLVTVSLAGTTGQNSQAAHLSFTGSFGGNIVSTSSTVSRSVNTSMMPTPGMPPLAGSITQLTGNFAQLSGNVIQLTEPLDSSNNVLFSGDSLSSQGNTITFIENITDTSFDPQLNGRVRKLVPIYPKTEETPFVPTTTSTVPSTSVPLVTEDQLLKIQYKEYCTKILSPELAPLLANSELCDTVLVCRDGKVITSSLLLATISPFLRSVLDSVIRIDQYKTVLMPDTVTVQSVLLLTNLVSTQPLIPLSTDQQAMVRELATTLGCTLVLDLTKEREVTQQIEQIEISPQDSLKRKGSSVKRKAKQPRLAGQAFTGAMKLEKTDLNPDYMDSSGLVRLSSAEEMSMHYCLLCDGKFKKYNQAITHYDCAHSLLAALSCDQCDSTFRDMYSCVKHKHEFHGQFDVNFQCFICKEVLYSRFRLGTHIKECHKPYYGEFVCRACGMKFAAQHYLTNHQKESHTDSANTCNICSKTFSGKRYLTMHIKANHESQIGGGEDLYCKDCERAFPSARDKAYHASKVHGAPRPEGAFEDCLECEKWFRTKGELAQHTARMHNKNLVDNIQ